MPAPKANAPINEHRKHVEEFLKLKDDKHLKEPKDRYVKTDRPPEDDNYKPKEW